MLPMSDEKKRMITTPECLEKLCQAHGLCFDSRDNEVRLGGWLIQALPDWVDIDGLNEPGGEAFFLGSFYQHLQWLGELGWQTAWYNPDGRLVSRPLHDVDLVTLKGVTYQFEKRQSPSFEICEAWWDEWSLPDNVRRHADRVAWLAYALAVILRTRGKSVDPILAHRGGMLHDLDKMDTLDEGHLHGRRGAAYVENQGYPVLAGIIRNHVLRSDLQSRIGDWSWEEKLVFFSDKLVEGDRLVSFPFRLSALKTRYPSSRQILIDSESVVFDLSDELCSILSIAGHKKLISWLDNLQNI